MPKNVSTQFILDVYAKAYADSLLEHGTDIVINHTEALLAVISATQPGEIYPKAHTSSTE